MKILRGDTNLNKNNKFIQDFYKKYPNYNIVEFKNLSSPMLVEDKDGFLYRKCTALRFMTHKISVESLVDKEGYVRWVLKREYPEYELLSFKNFSNGGFVIVDSCGLKYKVRWYDFIIKKYPVSIRCCINKYEYFVLNSNKKHNNKYKYPVFEYKTGKKVISIVCPFHGEFEQAIEAHLFGNGCPKCSRGGFSKEQYCKQNIGKIGNLYILKLSNKEECFLKIGVSVKDLRCRYRSSKLLYNYKIVDTYIFNMEACSSRVMEDELLKKFKRYKYVPKNSFDGQTECLKIECLNELLKELNYENISNF